MPGPAAFQDPDASPRRRTATLVLGTALLAVSCAPRGGGPAALPDSGATTSAADPATAATTPATGASLPAGADAPPSATAALDYARYGLPADGNVGVNEDLAIPRMSQEEAEAALGDAGTLFVDTRQEWEFRRGHIPGARKIQAFVEDHLLEDLPRDKTIVIYCACSAEQSSARAAVILQAMGHERVYALKNGWHAWVDGGRPVERSPQ